MTETIDGLKSQLTDKWVGQSSVTFALHEVNLLTDIDLACNRVKQYESKLAALNAINSALQKENDKLRKDLARASMPTTDAGGVALAI